MRRNKHIGLSFILWHVIAFFSVILIVVPLLKAIVLFLIKSLPDTIDIDGIIVTHEKIDKVLDYQWSYCYLIIAIIVFASLGRQFLKISKNKQTRNILDFFFNGLLGIFATLYIGFYLLIYKGFKHFKETTLLETDDIYEANQMGIMAFVIPGLVLWLVGGMAEGFFFPKIANIYRNILDVKDNSIFKNLFTLGYGGSADWANIVEYEKHEFKAEEHSTRGWETREPFLGKTLFQDDPFPRAVSIKDDVHIVTIGMTGSGKSTTVLYPNLALYEASAYVFDPKGELAKLTYRRRSIPPDAMKRLYSYKTIRSEDELDKIHNNGYTQKRGDTVCFLLDPFNETKDEFVQDCFNPLSVIDLNDPRATEIITAISDGCVTSTGKEKDQHWNEWAKNLIQALIVHVIDRYPKEAHTLPFILDLLTGFAKTYYEVPDGDQIDQFDELLIDMQTNDAFGGLARQVAAQISRMGENERGSVLSTTYRSLRWTGDPSMREQLSKTTIKFEVEKTVYIVLPPDLISAQMRWVRVLTSVFLIEEKRSGVPREGIPTLFILDEFHQLGGNLDAVTKGFPILRSAHIKLWLLFQSLPQLKSAFGDNWADITSASTVQVLGVNDPDTAEWVSTRLGSRNNQTRKKDKWYKQGEVMRERIDPLLTPAEVSAELGKNSNLQIVFPTQGKPMRLERLTYKPLGFGKDIRDAGIDLSGHFEDY